MTKEEMIEQLENTILLIKQNGKDWLDERDIPILEACIQRMKTEPCEDCISRQAVDNIFQRIRGLGEDTVVAIYEHILDLPSVQPKVKTGHWVMPVRDDGTSEPICYQVRCSKCGFDLDPQTFYEELKKHGGDKFCPKCGAKMENKELQQGLDNADAPTLRSAT